MSAGSRSWPGLLRLGAWVLDLGCGAGIPATRELTGHGLQVIGVDFSAVQLRRARLLVPAARLCRRTWPVLDLVPACLDAVVSFGALIQLLLADQRAPFGRVRNWLRPAGFTPLWDRFILEGDGRHSLILARARVE